MQSNSNYLSIFALVISAFIAGAFLSGERLRKKDAKAAIKEIKEEQNKIQNRVDLLKKKGLEGEGLLLRQIDSAYVVLENMSSKISFKKEEIERNRALIENIRHKINARKAVIEELSERGFGERSSTNDATN
ncbi:MAG: hypothetical protein AAGG68_24295 [Bacteroidota bacterium]